MALKRLAAPFGADELNVLDDICRMASKRAYVFQWVERHLSRNCGRCVYAVAASLHRSIIESVIEYTPS
jgi:hypothetical protein